MKIETTKMSSRGQVVIPLGARSEIEAEEGTIFMVMTSGDTLILKKIKTPSKEEILRNIEKISQKGEEKAKNLGIKEENVPEIVKRFRESKRSEK